MEELTLADYLAILRRWKSLFAGIFGMLALITVILVATWSNYRSQATVEVEQPQVAPTMTAATGSNTAEVPQSIADLRISKIEEKVAAPASLVDIITKFNLYPHARSMAPMAVVAKDMSDKIKLKLITSEIANPAATNRVSADQLSAIAFTLSFDYSDPQIARQVTSELVTRFLDEDLRQRREEAEATSEFLGNQIKALEVSLAEQEQKIAEFENEHGVSGPEALMFNQQAAASAVMSMQSLDTQIAANEGQQGSLRAQLAGVDPYSRVIEDGQMLTTPATELKALESQYSTLTAEYGPAYPDVIKVKHQIDSMRKLTGVHTSDTAALEAKITDVKTNLAAAQNTDGDDNPDIVSLQAQLTKLQDQLAEAQKNPAAHSAIKKDADNPAYLSIISQLDALQEQHKSLSDQREKLAAQQAKYEGAISKDPELEQQMAVLSRDHDNAQLRYREMKERKMAAEMDVQMIQDHKGEHLVVIDPPDLPQHTHPRGILLLIGGLFLSTLGAFASVILAQLLSHSIIGAHHLTTLLGVAPLVAVPHLYTYEEKTRLPHQKLFNGIRMATLRARGEVERTPPLRGGDANG